MKRAAFLILMCFALSSLMLFYQNCGGSGSQGGGLNFGSTGTSPTPGNNDPVTLNFTNSASAQVAGGCVGEIPGTCVYMSPVGPPSGPTVSYNWSSTGLTSLVAEVTVPVLKSGLPTEQCTLPELWNGFAPKTWNPWGNGQLVAPNIAQSSGPSAMLPCMSGETFVITMRGYKNGIEVINKSVKIVVAP